MFRKLRPKNYLLLFTAILILPLVTFAQNPVSWSLESDAKGKSLKSNETAKAKLKANIEGDWHLYAVEQPAGGPFPTKITIAENAPFQIDGKIESPAPITKFDPNFQIDTKFFAKQAEFNLPLKSTAETNGDDLAVNVKYQVCDDTVCLPPKTVKVSFAGVEDVKKRSADSSQQSA
ncbi:MAG: protein-disulfide reductase DsbD N-terminal domain-containing protein, partial [Pyrinomonadaceae bacterium]|nr:protein-disulfide reductase DsbD N-terminal domain-containing protein [Pyrinomonadaceae bacterium]